MSFIHHNPLQIDALNEAQLIPTQVDRQAKSFTGGVYQKKGELVNTSLRLERPPTETDHFRQISPLTLESTEKRGSESVQPYLKGRYLFLGYFSHHYGHFLIETLSRLWASQDREYDGYLFLDFVLPRDNPETLTPLSHHVFRALNIDAAKVHIVLEPTLVEQLDVPQRALAIATNAHKDAGDLFQKISHFYRKSEYQAPSKKVYLSRSQLNKRKRKVLNEVAIEKAFEQAGFDIVHVQTMTWPEQVDLYSQCAVLAGLEGSGLHNSVFMPPGGTVINLCSMRAPNRIKPTQLICDQVAGLHSKFVPFTGEIVDQEKLVTRYHIPDLKRWLRKWQHRHRASMNFDTLK